MCTYDQFSNLILTDAYERRIVRTKTTPSADDGGGGDNSNDGAYYYADVPLGMYVVRGDSMVLTGKLPADPASEEIATGMKRVSLVELNALEKQEEIEAPLEWDFDTDLTA